MITQKQKPLNVLFLASEADPLIKVGGLGDVAGSLPLAIQKLGNTSKNSGQVDIRLAIPFYPKLKEKLQNVQLITSFFVESADGPVKADLFSTQLSNVIVYLVAGEPFDKNPAVYGPDYLADAEKFVFFSLACLEIPRAIKWKIDILHANDWHTALSVYALEHQKIMDNYLSSACSVLSIHNLPFMGSGSEEALYKYLVPPTSAEGLPFWARLLPLPMGIASADKILAVSPTYANEMLTSEYGCGLETYLGNHKARLSGILNGLDLDSWDPSIDKDILFQFTSTSLDERLKNKLALQKEFGLEQLPDIPLLILISRMDHQKGVDIAIEGLRKVADLPWQAILLGSGHSNLEDACRMLQKDLPKKVRAAIQFDVKLSRRMYAGGDMLIMPSRYEPCGLAQMIAMRYGCIPVARATGGLVDTIKNTNMRKTGTGFLFPHPDPEELAATLSVATQIFKDKPRWTKMQITSMSQDFSWPKSAMAYFQVYQSLINPSEEGIK